MNTTSTTQVAAPGETPAATQVPAAPSKKWLFAESALVSALVSAVMTGLVTVWFESRLENSKEHVAAIIRQKDQVDSSQSNIITQIGLYTGKVYQKGDTSDKSQLESAIVSAQLQLNRLRDELPKSSHGIVDLYEKELSSLQNQLESVKTQNDLGPLYVSTQRILKIHDEMAESIRTNLQISLF